MADSTTILTIDEAIADLRNIETVLQSAPIPDAMRECVGVVRESIGENFTRQAAPDGPAWPPRKVVGDGHPLLDDTGFLKAAALGVGPGAITDVQRRSADIAIDDSVDLGGIRGAAVHNYGYPAGGLPQREFFAPSDDALDRCVDVIGDSVERRIDGGGSGGGGLAGGAV